MSEVKKNINKKSTNVALSTVGDTVKNTYRVVKGVVSLPMNILWLLTTLIRLGIIICFGIAIYEIVKLGKTVVDAFKSVENLIRKLYNEAVSAIENAINTIKNFF